MLACNRDLVAQLHKAARKDQRKDSAINLLQTELEACKIEIQTLRAKEQSLRDFVLENNRYQEVGDDEVISAFTNVRQGIQKIASSKLYQVDKKPLAVDCSAFAVEEDLSDLWQSSTRGNRLLILRALLFQVLTKEVFTYEFFGISRSKETEDKVPDTIVDLDVGLSRFERILVQRSG